MILDGIIALLVADSGVAALIATKIYKNVLPRGFVLPAVCVHRYGGSREYDFNGPVAVREVQVQFDVYGLDADSTQAIAEAIKVVLEPYKGTLPDGTVVQACYLERDMDLPFLPHADVKGLADRAVLGFRFVHKV